MWPQEVQDKVVSSPNPPLVGSGAFILCITHKSPGIVVALLQQSFSADFSLSLNGSLLTSGSVVLCCSCFTATRRQHLCGSSGQAAMRCRHPQDLSSLLGFQVPSSLALQASRLQRRLQRKLRQLRH